MALTDDQKTQLADLYDEAKQSGDADSMQRIKGALQSDAAASQPLQIPDAPDHPLYSHVGDRGTPQDLDIARAGPRLKSLARGAVESAAGATGETQPQIASRLQGLGLNDADSTSSPVNSMIGGMLSPTPGSLPGVAARAGAVAAPSAYDAAVSTLKNAGVRVDAAQAAPASKVANTAKNIVQDAPLIGMSDYEAAQKADYTSAVLKTIGADGREATPKVMNDARQAIKDTLDRVEGGYDVPLVQSGLAQDLVRFRAQAQDMLPAEQFAQVNKQIQSILTRASQQGGTIGGDQFQVIKRSVDELSNSSNSDVARYGTQLKNYMQNAMQKSITDPADQVAYNEARTMYRRMKQIEPAIGEDNQIAPSKLWNSIDRVSNANQTVYGQGDQQLTQLAQAGSQVLKRGTNNSGTAQRVAAMTALGTSSYAVEEAYHGRYGRAAQIMLMTIGGPALARYAITHPEAGPKIARLMQQSVRASGPVSGGVNAAEADSSDESIAPGQPAQ